MPSSDPSVSNKRGRRSRRAAGPSSRWVRVAIWGLFLVFLVGIFHLFASREPDRFNARDTYDSFSQALVAADYQRAFGFFNDEMAARYGSPTELQVYVNTKRFFPVAYRLGVLSSRSNTIRFTMEDGSEREARMRVRGFRPEVVFFEIPD